MTTLENGKSRLCLICATHGDGTNPNFNRLVNSLARKADEIQVVAWDRLNKSASICEVNGIRYHFLMHGWGFHNQRLAMALPLWMLRLFYYLLNKRPEALWASNFEAALPMALATCVTRVPFIYYIHDNISLSYKLPVLLKKLLEVVDSWVISRAKAIIVPDENRILDHAKKYVNKFHVLPNTPSADKAPQINGRSASHHSGLTVYVSGSLWESRGVLALMDAAEQVQDCRILMAGHIPEPSIAAIVNKHPRVDYRGRVSHQESLGLYSESDVVFAFYDPAVPINIHASPTKLYEAMMLGKPTLVNAEMLMSSKVTDWDIGYVAKYNDRDDLERVIRHMVKNPDELASKGQRAYALFVEKYDWRLIEPQLWRILDDVITGAHLSRG